MITTTSIGCRGIVAAAVFITTLATCGIGNSADGRENDELRYSITPYLWATGMSGDVKGGQLPETSVDMSFADIFDVLDFGFMTAIEVRKGRFGFLFDGIYMKVSDSATARDPLGALTVSADAEVKQTMLAFAAAWRILDNQVSLDGIGGFRYNKIEADADIDARLFGRAGRRESRSANQDWLDPYVGVRLYLPVTDALKLVGYLDVGGFGVGSDFTWQGLAGLEYTLSDTFMADFGYRYLYIDYDEDGFRYDMTNDGPYAGLTISF